MFNAYDSKFKRFNAKSQDFFALSILILFHRFIKGLASSLLKDKRCYALDNRSFYLIRQSSIADRRRVFIAEARLSAVDYCNLLIFTFLFSDLFRGFFVSKSFIFILINRVFAPGAVLIG